MLIAALKSLDKLSYLAACALLLYQALNRTEMMSLHSISMTQLSSLGEEEGTGHRKLGIHLTFELESFRIIGTPVSLMNGTTGRYLRRQQSTIRNIIIDRKETRSTKKEQLPWLPHHFFLLHYSRLDKFRRHASFIMLHGRQLWASAVVSKRADSVATLIQQNRDGF
jgi:hypothetical protein